MKLHLFKSFKFMVDCKTVLVLFLTLIPIRFRGTHTVYFSISFHNLNQMPMPLELIFTVKPQVSHVLVVKILQCMYLCIMWFLIK